MFQPLRFLTAGESHGPKLVAILEGCPAGILISKAKIDEDLARRQQGFGCGGRMKIESDQVRILSGIAQGKSTGAPICFEIENKDYANWSNKSISPMNIPRPGHADLTGAIKYGHFDLRLSLERASARESAMRVCVGAVCKEILAQFGIKVGGYVSQVGTIDAGFSNKCTQTEIEARIKTASLDEFAFGAKGFSKKIKAEISACMNAKNTLGGVFEVAAVKVPIGLGSYVHWDRKLEAQISWALMSIPAIKGVEFGHAFANAGSFGTEVHDEMFLDECGQIYRKSNRAAGFEGGVSTGEPIVARCAMKPISTTLKPLRSVDLAKKVEASTVYERSDFCAITRAVPIGEAMLAFVLANALLEKLGCDRLDSLKLAFKELKGAKIDDINLSNKTWKFGYDQ